MFINDITTVFKHCNFHLYADDIQLYLSDEANNHNSMVNRLNTDLTAVSAWSNNNGIKLNPDKTKVLCISRNKIDYNNFSSIFLNNISLEIVYSVRNLGVIFNNSLQWNNHVDVLVSKVYGALRRLSICSSSLPLHIRKRLATTMILPLFTYACEIYCHLDSSSFRKLTVAFNSVIRYVFRLRRYDHVSPYIAQYPGYSIQTLFKYKCVILLTKILMKTTPSYLSDYVSFGSSKRSLVVSVPRHKYTISERQFLPQSIRLWNNLPLNIRRLIYSDDPDMFDSELLKYFVLN